MSRTDDHSPTPGRVLTSSTFVLAAAAAVVLALGTFDARLLRLSLVAALWAALLGAFIAERMRRESSSCAERADQLRTVYQLELEREVAARREHTLTVKRELLEQAESSQRREIVELRAEVAAMRANLEQLVGGNPLVEQATMRAESSRLLQLPTHPWTSDDSHDRAPVAVVTETPRLSGAELRFGPSRLPTPARWSAPSPADREAAYGGASNGHGRHGVPSREWPVTNDNGQRANGFQANGSHTNGFHTNGFHTNGSHTNGAHTNGADVGRTPGEKPMASQEPQRTVSDLLAAHRADSAVRRRRNHEAG
jgi:Domain of unknown function (DUF6779)